MCELCDKLIDKDKIGRIMVKKCSALHEEVIYVFMIFVYTRTIEKLSFHLSHVRILGSTECWKTRNDFPHDNT